MTLCHAPANHVASSRVTCHVVDVTLVSGPGNTSVWSRHGGRVTRGTSVQARHKSQSQLDLQSHSKSQSHLKLQSHTEFTHFIVTHLVTRCIVNLSHSHTFSSHTFSHRQHEQECQKVHI